jgi:hypothetical protein
MVSKHTLGYICFHTIVKKKFVFLKFIAKTISPPKQLKIRTDMNSDAPYESVVRTSLIPLQGQKSWGQLPSLLLKIEGGGEIVLAINLRKTNFFFTIV